MNRRRIATVLPVFVAGAFVGAGMQVPSHSAGSKVTNLLTADLSTDFTPEREVLIDLVEIPPNQKLEWHWHPGEEFHYYREGNPVIQRRDARPIIGEPGTAAHGALKLRHRATAGDKGAKIIVFRVHTQGAPWRYLDQAPTQKRSGE